MKEGGVGGEKTTTGLRFERSVDFLALIRRVPRYTTRRSAIAGTDVLFDGIIVYHSIKFVSGLLAVDRVRIGGLDQWRSEGEPR